MKKIADILNRKGSDVVSVKPQTTVIEALKIMANKNIGSVAVMEDDIFLGLMTERDYARKIILKGHTSSDTTAAEIMTTDSPAITRNDSVEHCMEIMASNNIRYLPVIENNKLAGIISINDVVAETILHQKETIEHLQNYINS